MDTANKTTESDLIDRCRAAIWGQFIGDAACLGPHLVADPDELKRLYPEGVKLFDQPASGKQEGKKPGDLTHYGDSALLMLQSVADLGYFSAPDFGPRFIAHFTAEDYRGYQDNATKSTVRNYRIYTEGRPHASYHFQGGADDDSPATATRLAPVVVNRVLKESLLKVVESATRVCQNNQRAVTYTKCHALLTKELLLGSDLRDAVKSAAKTVAGDGEVGREISSATEKVCGLVDKGMQEVAAEFGLGSSVKSCFPDALHCALKHQDAFRQAILETANGGGNCAARAAMIGTWLGALHGMQGIPAEWRDRLTAKDDISRYIEKVVAKISR